MRVQAAVFVAGVAIPVGLGGAIGGVVSVPLVPGRGREGGLDAVGGHHRRPRVVAGPGQPRHPALELQAGEHHQVGLGQGPGIGGPRGEDVGVAVGAHQGGDLDVFAAHLLDHVGEDAEAGKHLDPLRGGRVGGQGEQRRGAGEQGGRPGQGPGR